MQGKKPKLLLHVCCSSCSPYVLKTLSQDFEITIFYYNPNIQPYEEYLKRRLDIEGYVRSLGIDFFEGEYEDLRWHYMAEGLENEHEGGARCLICFRMRANKVAFVAATHGFEWFATTLTVSPYKNSRVINRICRELAADYGINFYDADFKKKDGSKLNFALVRELGFYRQDYCGCLYSLEEARVRRQEREELQKQTDQIISPVNMADEVKSH
jgi:predicted adenine nucleotide alpha hydrolase (AANH) superfamily ATPase